jgi:protein SCO1
MASNPRHKATRTQSWRSWSILGSAVVVLVAGYATMLIRSVQPRALDANLAGLLDDEGRTLDRRAFAGRYKLVFFGFTQCSSVCPLTLTRVRLILGDLGSGEASLTPLFVSVDPGHDKPSVLKAYVRNFDPRIVGITGDATRIEQLVHAYGVLVERHAGATGPFTLDHTARLYLVTPDDSLLTSYEPEERPQDIATDIARRIRG